MSYAIFLTGIFAFFSYKIVKQNYSENEKKSKELKEFEEKFVKQSKLNIEQIKKLKMETKQENTNEINLNKNSYNDILDHIKKGGYD